MAHWRMIYICSHQTPMCHICPNLSSSTILKILTTVFFLENVFSFVHLFRSRNISLIFLFLFETATTVTTSFLGALCKSGHSCLYAEIKLNQIVKCLLLSDLYSEMGGHTSCSPPLGIPFSSSCPFCSLPPFNSNPVFLEQIIHKNGYLDV